MGRQHVKTGAVLEGGKQYGDVGPVLDTLGAEVFSDGSCAVPEP